MQDKLIISNSLNLIFVGIANTNNLDKKCSNSIIYGDPTDLTTFGMNSNSLHYLLPCDDIAPDYSYSRFLLIMKNDTIFNIGLECSEDNLTCLNTYFTIYSVKPLPFRFDIEKRKVMINPSNSKFADAILSNDDNYIYLLLNYGQSPKLIFALGTIDLKRISSLVTLDCIRFPDITFPLMCSKIHEYNTFQFALHCLSIEYNPDYTSLNYCCGNQKEVIYFIQRVNDKLIPRIYFDFYNEKYL